MERLTKVRQQDGKKKLCVVGMNEDNKESRIAAVVKKLKDYEDTGLEPSEVKMLLIKQTGYGCKWCERYDSMDFFVRNKNGVVIKTAGNIPAVVKCKFCPNCGRKLRGKNYDKENQ